MELLLTLRRQPSREIKELKALASGFAKRYNEEAGEIVRLFGTYQILIKNRASPSPYGFRHWNPTSLSLTDPLMHDDVEEEGSYEGNNINDEWTLIDDSTIRTNPGAESQCK